MGKTTFETLIFDFEKEEICMRKAGARKTFSRKSENEQLESAKEIIDALRLEAQSRDSYGSYKGLGE